MSNDFIIAHRNDNIYELALHLAGDSKAEYILRQIDGWQRLRHKVPVWADNDKLLYPRRLSLEQCSGEEAARYKANLVKLLLPQITNYMVDLTGGFGVDFSFIAPYFQKSVYVEQNEELCRLACHNFSVLGIQADIICADSVEYLKNMSHAELIFIDPARRSNTGHKTVLLHHCEPDITQIIHLLLTKSTVTLVKLSPMLDLYQAITSLNSLQQCVKEVHVVAFAGECKELLIVLQANVSTPLIYCADGTSLFTFYLDDEKQRVPIAANPQKYIYEPNPTILKAGAFQSIGRRFHLEKLHINTHLYTSDVLVPDFPGRCFRLLSIHGFGKKDIKPLVGHSANLAIRNFPSDVDSIRNRLKLRDGGDEYWFATTLADSRKVILRCEKV